MINELRRLTRSEKARGARLCTKEVVSEVAASVLGCAIYRVRRRRAPAGPYDTNQRAFDRDHVLRPDRNSRGRDADRHHRSGSDGNAYVATYASPNAYSGATNGCSATHQTSGGGYARSSTCSRHVNDPGHHRPVRLAVRRSSSGGSVRVGSQSQCPQSEWCDRVVPNHRGQSRHVRSARERGGSVRQVSGWAKTW